jgi:hypothetical protein
MGISKGCARCTSLIGFANFYRRFINGFSKVVAPLIALAKKGIPLE